MRVKFEKGGEHFNWNIERKSTIIKQNHRFVQELALEFGGKENLKESVVEVKGLKVYLLPLLGDVLTKYTISDLKKENPNSMFLECILQDHTYTKHKKKRAGKPCSFHSLYS